MKKLFFSLFFLFFGGFFFAYNWKDIYDVFSSVDISNGQDNISETEYIVIKDCKIYDEKGNIKGTLIKGDKIECSKFIGLHDNNFLVYNRDEYAFSYKDGWVLASNLAIPDSEILPEIVISNNSDILQKLWVPCWYNEVAKSNSPLEVFNNYTDENLIPEYHNLLDVIKNGEKIICFHNCIFDLNGIPYKIQKIYKKNNIYCIKCRIESIYQTYIREGWSDNKFDNFPSLENGSFFLLKMEINGNRVRLYESSSNELIVELMCVTPSWIYSLENSLISNTNQKGLYSINAKLDRKWTDPSLIDFPEAEDSLLQPASISGSSFKPGMIVKVEDSKNKIKKIYPDTEDYSYETAVLAGNGYLKILEVSDKTSYDNNHWLKVEIFPNQIDILTEKIIPDGTIGWCLEDNLEIISESDIPKKNRSKRQKKNIDNIIQSSNKEYDYKIGLEKTNSLYYDNVLPKVNLDFFRKAYKVV